MNRIVGAVPVVLDNLGEESTLFLVYLCQDSANSAFLCEIHRIIELMVWKSVFLQL